MGIFIFVKNINPFFFISFEKIRNGEGVFRNIIWEFNEKEIGIPIWVQIISVQETKYLKKKVLTRNGNIDVKSA